MSTGKIRSNERRKSNLNPMKKDFKRISIEIGLAAVWKATQKATRNPEKIIKFITRTTSTNLSRFGN
jgi:hypothetical protein